MLNYRSSVRIVWALGLMLTNSTVALKSSGVGLPGLTLSSVGIQQSNQSPSPEVLKGQLEVADAQIKELRKGTDQVALANQLQVRARTLRLLVRLKEAADSQAEMLTIFKKANLPARALQARIAITILLSKDDPEKSAQFEKEAVDQAYADQNTPKVSSQVMHDGGLLANTMGLTELSKRLFLVAVSIRDKTEPDSLNAGWSHKNVGDMAAKLNDPKTAVKEYEIAIAIREKLAPDSIELDDLYTYMRGMLIRLDDKPGIYKWALRSLPLEEKIAPNSVRLAATLSTIAALSGTSEVEQQLAAKYRARAEAIFKPMRSDTTINNSSTYQRMLDSADKDIVIAKKGSNLESLGIALEARSRALQLLENYSEAGNTQLEIATIYDKLEVTNRRAAARVMAATFFAKTDPNRSKQLLQEGFDIARSDTKTPKATAQSIHNVGLIAEPTGLLDISKQIFGVALSMRNIYEPNSLNVAWSHKKLGDNAYAISDMKTARKEYVLAASLRAPLAPYSPELEWLYHRISDIDEVSKDYINAFAWLKKALVIDERIHPKTFHLSQTFANLYGLGTILDHDVQECEGYLESAIAVSELIDPSSVDAQRDYRSLTTMFRSFGRFKEAEEAARRFMSVSEKLGDNKYLAYSYYLLGYMSLITGDLPVSEHYNKLGIDFCKRTEPQGVLRRWMQTNLARVYVMRGEFEEAEVLLKQIIEMPKLPPVNVFEAPWTEWTCAELAVVYAYTGRLPEALKMLELSDQIVKDAKSADPDAYTWPENMRQEKWGDYSYSSGNLEEAYRLYSLSHGDVPFSNYDSIDLENLVILMKKGIVAEKLGKHEEADKALTESVLRSRKLEPSSMILAQALFAVGDVLVSRKQLSEAEKNYREAWEIMRLNTSSLMGDLSNVGASSSSSRYAETLVRTDVQLSKIPEAFLVLEQSRAQSLRKLLAERNLNAPEQPSNMAEKVKLAKSQQRLSKLTLDSVLREISQTKENLTKAEDAFKSESDEFARTQLSLLITEFKRTITSNEAKLEGLKLDLVQKQAQTAKAYAEMQRNNELLVAEPLQFANARKSLNPGVLYIAFAVGDYETTVFITSRTGETHAYNLRIPANILANRIDEYRRLVSDKNSAISNIAVQGRTLFREIFPPAAINLMSGASHILISPDGPFWDLPFAALVTNNSGAPTYLGLQKPLAFTQSLTIFSLLGATSTSKPTSTPSEAFSATVVGDPLFSRGDSAQKSSSNANEMERSFVWGGSTAPSRLPGTRLEAIRIARMYNSVALLDQTATEENLRKQISKADVIHLATHGYTNPKKPMSSGVLLTVPIRGSTSTNDGALQASEILDGLKLKADLAVLSACETGIGKKTRGEGVIGLTRALQVAGVKSIVASQWKVTDNSTSDLMVTFHSLLRSGVNKDEALQKAMLSLQKSEKTSHPSYWAPFILTGDTGKLKHNK